MSALAPKIPLSLLADRKLAGDVVERNLYGPRRRLHGRRRRSGLACSLRRRQLRRGGRLGEAFASDAGNLNPTRAIPGANKAALAREYGIGRRTLYNYALQWRVSDIKTAR